MESNNKLIIQFKKLKEQLDSLNHFDTLKKYRILSKMFKLGKKMYGVRYSIRKLAIEADMPYTTVKRIMSLEKANKNTWKLINERKISAFKAAYILYTKNTKLQIHKKQIERR